MIALDTNVIVRVVTGDDPEQQKTAVRVMQEPRLWLTKTVLLETEWVLRFSYGLDAGRIHQTFIKLLGLPNLEIEDRAVVLRALADLAAGLDFADALHLRSGTRVERFATFDRKLAGKSPAGGPRILLLEG